MSVPSAKTRIRNIKVVAACLRGLYAEARKCYDIRACRSEMRRVNHWRKVYPDVWREAGSGDVRLESKMRRIVLAMLIAAGFGIIGASGGSAAPANGVAIAELIVHQTDRVIQVRESCGVGRHRNWGHCVPGCGPGWFQPYPDAHCRLR